MVCKAKVTYRKGVIGGTFDVLHVGHKKLLSTALTKSDLLLIGLTSDNFANISRGREVSPFGERMRRILDFISIFNKEEKVRIVKIDDPFGPSIEDPNLEVLFVTENLLHNAFKVNRLRISKNMEPLDLFVVPLVKADDGRVISSTRVRMGEINEEGFIVHR